MGDDLEKLAAEVVACRKCPRLVAWREQVARTRRRAYLNWDYWGRPVPGFGDPQARVLAVGLAPGAHGSNRTGRMFTGDASGNFMYAALHRAGFASQPNATARDDGLTLTGLYITAVGRCAPPANKPTSAELDACQPYLERELALLQPKVLVALGRIAFDRLVRLYSRPTPGPAFAHGAVYPLDGGRWLLACYHPSRQNTQTGRLTADMFDQVWARARALLEET
jgi:uracil-DNA glycosylase